jgi:hypothetical protein
MLDQGPVRIPNLVSPDRPQTCTSVSLMWPRASCTMPTHSVASWASGTWKSTTERRPPRRSTPESFVFHHDRAREKPQCDAGLRDALHPAEQAKFATSRASGHVPSAARISFSISRSAAAPSRHPNDCGPLAIRCQFARAVSITRQKRPR